MFSKIKNKSLFFILLFALIARVLLLVAIIIKNPAGIYVYDSNGYWNISYNLIHSGIYSQSANPPLDIDYFRTPIYPLFIMLCESIGPEGFSIIALQLILSVATCYITYRIAKSITKNIFIANISALIIAIDLPSIALANIVLTETLFGFLFALCFLFFIEYLQNKKTKHIIYTAIFSGLMILCRPIGFFIPFFFVLFLLIYNWKKDFKPGLKNIVIYGLLTFIMVSPWLIRNKIVFNHYFLSVIRQHDLQNYQAAAIYAEKYHKSLAQSQRVLQWKTFEAFKQNGNRNGNDFPYEYAQFIQQESAKIIKENPSLFIKHHFKEIISFFLKPSRAYFEIQLGYWGKGYDMIPNDYPIVKYLFEHNGKVTILLVFFQLFTLLIIYLAFIFGFLFLKKEKLIIHLVLLTLTIIIFANLNLPQVTEARFRMPIMPLIAIISASGIYFLKEKFIKKISEKTNMK